MIQVDPWYEFRKGGVTDRDDLQSLYSETVRTELSVIIRNITQICRLGLPSIWYE